MHLNQINTLANLQLLYHLLLPNEYSNDPVEELEIVGNYDHYQVSMNPAVPTFVIVLIEHHDRNRFTHNWRRTYGSFHRV